jgi:N-methylhydantoinase A/oxoprolinase/acetone carboxylase beta subunit
MFGSALSVGDLHAEETMIYWRPALDRDTVIEGPAAIEQYDTTTIIPPGWTARVDDHFNLVLVHGRQ